MIIIMENLNLLQFLLLFVHVMSFGMVVIARKNKKIMLPPHPFLPYLCGQQFFTKFAANGA